MVPCLAFLVLASSPPTIVQIARLGLSPPDVSEFAAFGSSVDLDGDTAVICARGDVTGGPAAGSIHIYERSGGAWTRTFHRRGAAQERLGLGVAVDGDVVAVGRGFAQSDVIVLERQAGVWAQTDILTYPGDPVFNPQYGSDVAISGNYLAVGAPTASEGGVLAGAVYVYERGPNGWGLAARFAGTLPGGAFPTSPNLGRRVELQGDTLIASAPRTSIGGVFHAGGLQVYERGVNNWAHTATFGGPIALAARDLGGRGMVLDGDFLAVGAVGYDHGATPSAGVVEVFERSGGSWSFVAPVFDPQPTPYGAFGLDLGLSGDRLIVARSGYHVTELSSLPLVLATFQRTGSGAWAHTENLGEPHAGPDQGFSSSIALDGTTLIAPASAGYVDDTARGKVYIASTSTPWTSISETVCPGTACACPTDDGWAGCGNSTEEDGWLFADGTASISADDLQLIGRQLVPNQTARLRLGPNLAMHSLFGDGDLCLHRGIDFPVQTVASNGAVHFGGGQAGTGLVAQGTAAGLMILPGETWYFQLVYGDVTQVFRCRTWTPSYGGGVWHGRPSLVAGGFNTTNAVAVTWRP